MRRNAFEKILSLVLTLALCLQLFPATLVNAEEADAASEISAAETVPEPVEETVPEVDEKNELETVEAATMETAEESQPDILPETTGETPLETVNESQSEPTEELIQTVTEAETDPWEIIAACGGPQTPYAFGPDIIYELPETGESVQSMELLKQLLESNPKTTSTTINWSGNTLNSMPLDAGEQLILLSVTDPRVYQKTVFEAGNATGQISLYGEVKSGDIAFTFQGLGSKEYPFQGSFVNSGFTVNRTLFNALEYSDSSFNNDSLTVAWVGEASVGAIVASTFKSTTTELFNVAINSDKQLFRDAAFGTISGDLNLTISFSNGIAFENKSSSANAGLVANTVTDGTLALTVNSFPSSITIGIDNNDNEKNNAGLLVGYLKNASLTLNNAMTPPIATIQAPQGGAGGIVGRIDRNDSGVSTITLNDTIALTRATIVGKYTGGVAGYAQNAAFAFGEDKKIALPASLGVKANKIVGSGYVSSQYTGGIFGWYKCDHASAYSSYDGTGFTFPDDPIAINVNVASGEAGALFGRLELGTDRSFVAETPESVLDIKSQIVVADTTVGYAGGLIGKLTGKSEANTLFVRNANVSVPGVTTNKVQYLGGLVGAVENASVSVTNVGVTAPSPSATSYFGGLVASLGEKCVLTTSGTVTVSTTAADAKTATSIAKGGGLVGEAKAGSAVQLSGTTDLSSVAYTAGASVGQLVANQDRALIFATGSGNGGEDDSWTYKRSTAQSRVDDIGNYGQVIRLGGQLSSELITIDDKNDIVFENHGSYGDIGSEDDFALHAIAFATGDAFGLYSNISSATIQKTNVTLTGDIDLSGTGIQGLTRDNGSDQWDGSTNGTGSGVIFDGNNHTIKINTGEIYGKRGNDLADGEGSGQCYRHGYYGLFGKVNSAIVNNLTINSTMNIGADVNTYAGAVFGWVNGGHAGNGSVNTLNTVTLSDGSKINVDGTPPANTYSHVGGFIGYVAGEDTGVTVKNSSMQGDISYTGTSDSVMLGGILGKDNYSASIDLQFEEVTVGGSISSSTTGNAHVGGLVADINASSATNRDKNGAKMSLKKVVVSSEIKTSAATTSGGLLGYYWDNVDVTFDGTGEEYAVTTYSGDKQASLTASGAAVGGLCFAATGRWNMQGKAVDMGSTSISNGVGDLGLLVCHGERQGSTPGAYTDENAKALYLVMNTKWDTAYNNKDVDITSTATVFDEIVAYTARDKNITLNDAGIISLHTTGDKVNMTSGTRNTYVNRTGYGKGKQTNPYSRYYYNLETLTVDGDDINTSGELLLWSVRQYGAANIREYLTILDSDPIKSNTITENLDMDGYSYYPVSVANTSVTVQDATITFHNQDIESKEETTDSQNKSTLGRTQHFSMHSGLLLDYYTDSSAGKTATLTVNNLTLLGTVGMVDSGSGALICGKIYGYDGTKSVELELDTLKVDSGDSHLSVSDFNSSYAPLLINSVGSYAALNITGVTANKTGAGATSLMGNVGDESATGISLNFSNMILPDKFGRFTRATLLESLQYSGQNNAAAYNFTKVEDWNGEKYQHHVTYGKEIGGTKEYIIAASNPNQKYYANSKDLVQYPIESGYSNDFSAFLPYVSNTDGNGSFHEMRINHSLEDIRNGCGTYSDPYQIGSEDELQSIAMYLSTGYVSQGWQLNIAVPQGDNTSIFCSGTAETASHVTYTYQNGKWKARDKADLSNDTVLTYLRNAYYQITDDIEVSNFTGFGTQADPFRGVIVGKTGNETITLKGKLPQGFIVYSYGSVVKNLKLDVQGTTSVSFAEIKNNQGYTSESFFGGVMGCVLGGDNIIDGVNVIYPDTPPVTLKEKDASNKKKDHLIPVGGYVGVISGGGVIFRGNNTLTSVPNSYVNNDKYFYANRYVGRVLQGFAVQEGASDANQELDNSKKNYQICQLDSTKTDSNASISVNGNAITLRDAQALLVFSSVTNSGGAGGGKVLPYFSNAGTCWNGTTFGATSVGGKVRNASYSSVGNAAADNEDYVKSLKDDFTAFGQDNTSYLDTHYAGGKLFSVCNTSETGYTLNLAGGTYDMTVYGNGYRSISPRYLANAVCGNATNSTVGSNYQYLNPLISCFNGNGAKIKTNIVSKEYVDDDHHAIAVGGIFNTVRFTSDATMKDVTIGGTEGDNNKGTISHEYYEWTGSSCADATHKNWNGRSGFTNLTYPQGRGLIGIGGFAGNNVMSTDFTENSEQKITFEKVNTEWLHIKGPFDAGGIIGHTGMRVANSLSDDAKNYEIFYLTGTRKYYVIPTFRNCSYKNIQIDGGMMVGGYAGYITYDMAEPLNGSRQDKIVEVTFTEESDGVLGMNASIICQRAKTDSGIDNSPRTNGTGRVNCLPASGGLFGCSSLAIKVDNTKTAVIQDVTVRSGRSAGGVVAWPLSSVTIKNLSVTGNEEKRPQIGDILEYGEDPVSASDKVCEFAGGFVGYHEGSNKLLIIENCTAENLLVAGSLRSDSYPSYAAGIVGDIHSNANHIVANCKVKNVKLVNDSYKSGKKECPEGGIIGRLQTGNLYGGNLLADSVECVARETGDPVGNLIGQVDSGKIVYLAGVSIQNSKNLQAIVQTDIGGTKPATCYVAYADYTGAAQKDSATPPENLSGSVVTDSAAPYVTTSPRGVEIPIGDSEGNQGKMYLYGDGANPDIVKIISEQTRDDDNKRFYYSAASKSSFDSRYSSTFYAEMGLTAETAKGIPNFPVLQVPVADKESVSTQIVDYLNLVTNNGYSTARSTSVGASSHVESTIDLYRWSDKGYFEKNPSGVAKAFSGSGDNFETSFTNYDSGKNQFELLTVTFTELVKINNVNYSYQYNIQVPIVVRRMLEVDFTATLKDSPSFKASDYEVYKTDGFKSNITVGYGVSVSAMLTFTYNRAIGEPQTFGWQTYLENGGFMGDPEQTIQFYNPNSKLKSLPKGAQLILLDCADNNKAYRYSVNVQSESEGTKVKLSDFKDSQEASYSSRWLSEIMGVTAKQNDNGNWVLLENSSGATARIKTENVYQYFRPKTKEDTDTTKLYTLTAATGASGQELQPTEQFYLVIYIPDASVENIPETSEEEGKNLNGYISASLPRLDGRTACNINAVRVKKDDTIVTDSHSSSESTYNFLSGYVQSLSDSSVDKAKKLETDPEAYILLDQPEADGNYLLHMDLVDEITVVKGQKDTAKTPLFFKTNVSLPNYAKGEHDSVTLVTANGFPTGCYGTVEFYVYLQDDNGTKTYYKWDGNNWGEASKEESVLSYEWEADGKNMELCLGTDNTEADAATLAGIREEAKKENGKFYVETKMDIHMSVPAAEQVIAGANTKGNAYTKLSYTTYLASSWGGFSSTNYVESRQGEVRYYQSRSGSSTLTHSANDPTQLGINCSDLASANGVIYTTGVYDLSTVSNAENLIKDADRVEYTLTLWQRQENGKYTRVENNLEKYVRSVYMKNHQLEQKNPSDSEWQWTDVKAEDRFETADPENGKRFLLPIRVQVNTDVETNDVTFANYQLRLTATLYKGGEILDQPVNKETQNEGKPEYVRYDYVTYTITRILTDGYWGQQAATPEQVS